MNIMWKPRGKECSRKLMVVMFVLGVHAVAEDNTITNITTVINYANASYIVGNTGTNNLLTIGSGGILTNVNRSYIGLGVGASNNAAVVTDSGKWFNQQIRVGQGGSGNTLTITNGGAIYSSGDVIGYSSANNNAATVTGNGSLWSIANNLHIGYSGAAGNTLTFTIGGTVSNL